MINILFIKYNFNLKFNIKILYSTEFEMINKLKFC